MNRTLILLIVLALIPAAAALTITEPAQDITPKELPTEVVAQWEANYTEYLVTLLKHNEVYLNETVTDATYAFTLQNGTYELTVTAENSTDTTTFTVREPEPEPVELGISVENDTYDVGDRVHLTASTNTPVTAELEVLLQGDVVGFWELPMESSVNLIYYPDEPGVHTARLRAQGQEVDTTFTVEEKEPLSVDFAHDTARVNRQTRFNGTATGGVAPYTYNWVFSDNTTSSGRNVVHYFFEKGPHKATLVVRDAEGTQESVTKSVDVTTPSYALEVVVRTEHAVLVQGASVRLRGEGYDETQTTQSSGFVTFEGLIGNYTLRVTHNSSVYVNETVEMTQDDTRVITIPGSEEQPEEETEEEVFKEETQETIKQTSNEPTTDELRQKAIETLTQRKFNLQLSSTTDSILNTLDLYQEFDTALRQLETASELQIARILESVPKDVTVRDEHTTVSYPDPQDVEDYTQEFLEVRGVQDERLTRQYRHSIKEASKDVTIRTTTRAVTIYYEDREEKYVIVTKEIEAPENSHFIEFIPQTLAQDVSQLTLIGTYDVLRSNPIVRFSSQEYTYFASATQSDAGYTLVVPKQLQDPPGLLGFVSVRFGETSPTRGIIYLFLLGIFMVGIVAGGKISKKRQSTQLVEDFTELATQAIDAINQGNGHVATQMTPEIVAIYEELGEEQQAQVRDIVEHLTTHQHEQQFLGYLQEAYTTVRTTQDINAISAAYEKTLTAYEHLPNERKQQLEPHVEQLHTYIDNSTL